MLVTNLFRSVFYVVHRSLKPEFVQHLQTTVRTSFKGDLPLHTCLFIVASHYVVLFAFHTLGDFSLHLHGHTQVYTFRFVYVCFLVVLFWTLFARVTSRAVGHF